MKQLWYPPASRVQTYDNVYPGMVADRIDGVILHSTEGVGWPSYARGASAPTLTVKINREQKKLEWRQHFQINRSARALAGRVGGISTNRFHIVQIEIVGTSGWATTRNPAAVRKAPNTYILDDKWYVPNYPNWFWEQLADFLIWLNKEWGTPLVAPMKFVSWAHSNRMSESQWNNFKGVAGHQHVPHNDHTDPGIIPIDVLMMYAKNQAPVAQKPASPAPVIPSKEDDVSASDVWNQPIDLRTTPEKGDTRSAGAQLAETLRQTVYSVNAATKAASNSDQGLKNDAQIIGMLDAIMLALTKISDNTVEVTSQDIIDAAYNGAYKSNMEFLQNAANGLDVDLVVKPKLD